MASWNQNLSGLRRCLAPSLGCAARWAIFTAGLEPSGFSLWRFTTVFSEQPVHSHTLSPSPGWWPGEECVRHSQHLQPCWSSAVSWYSHGPQGWTLGLVATNQHLTPFVQLVPQFVGESWNWGLQSACGKIMAFTTHVGIRTAPPSLPSHFLPCFWDQCARWMLRNWVPCYSKNMLWTDIRKTSRADLWGRRTCLTLLTQPRATRSHASLGAAFLGAAVAVTRTPGKPCPRSWSGLFCWSFRLKNCNWSVACHHLEV